MHLKNKILLIDMYGVIIKESKGCFIPYTFEHFDRSEYDRLTKAFKEERCFTRAQNGNITNNEFLKYLGYTDPETSMKDYLMNYLSLDEQFIPFAKKYSNDWSMCLLSNDVSEWSEFLTEYYKLNSFFREKIISGKVHMRKPDKQIFLYSMNKLGCEPDECIFVDNSVANLQIAEETGIRTILFNRDSEEYDGKVVYDFIELGKMLENI